MVPLSTVRVSGSRRRRQDRFPAFSAALSHSSEIMNVFVAVIPVIDLDAFCSTFHCSLFLPHDLLGLLWQVDCAILICCGGQIHAHPAGTCLFLQIGRFG